MIKLFYCTDLNFGDAMSPLVVKMISGQDVSYASEKTAELMAVGSVFYHGGYFMGDWRGDRLSYLKGTLNTLNRKLRKPIKVWGSGFLKMPVIQYPYFKRDLEVYALRGRITHSIIERYNHIPKSMKVAYGDPGLLYARLCGIHQAPQHNIGIIPHVMDCAWGDRLKAAFTKIGVDVVVINAADPPDKVVAEIAGCERIISSSLHGLIASDSLSIPNLHVQLSTLTHSQSDFELKFRDYYSAYDEEMPTPVDPGDLISNTRSYVDNSRYIRHNPGQVRALQNQLIDAFPLSLRK